MNDSVCVKIASLNIACSKIDEAGSQPLWKRLDTLLNFISEQSKDFSILCVQEVRPTGPLSPFDVIEKIRKALGATWEFSAQKINPSALAFYRVIFFDSSRWHHVRSNVIYSPNLKFPLLDYAAVVSDFAPIESDDKYVSGHRAAFRVINAHAPCPIHDRLVYWKTVFQAMKESTNKNIMLIGDMNKFTEDVASYEASLAIYKLVDHIGLDITTFVSFPGDVDANGNQFRSCLDAVITPKDLVSQVKIVSTEPEPRVTDHFLIISDNKFTSPRYSLD